MREKDREARELQEKNVRTAELIRDQIERMKERFEREKADLIQNGLPKGDDVRRAASRIFFADFSNVVVCMPLPSASFDYH